MIWIIILTIIIGNTWVTMYTNGKMNKLSKNLQEQFKKTTRKVDIIMLVSAILGFVVYMVCLIQYSNNNAPMLLTLANVGVIVVYGSLIISLVYKVYYIKKLGRANAK